MAERKVLRYDTQMNVALQIESNLQKEISKLNSLAKNSDAYVAQLKKVEAEMSKLTGQTRVLNQLANNGNANRRKNQEALVALEQRLKAVLDQQTASINQQAAAQSRLNERRRTGNAFVQAGTRSIQRQTQAQESNRRASSGGRFPQAGSGRRATTTPQPQSQGSSSFGSSFLRGIGGSGGSLASGLGQSAGILLRYGLTGAAIAATIQGLRAIVSILPQGVTEAIRFEQAFVKIAAVTGQATKDIEGLSVAAKEIAGTTIFKVEDIQQLQLELAKLGFTVREITAATPAIARLAQATGEDLSTAAAITGKALRAFQLEASSAGSVASTLTGIVNGSALTLERLGTGLQYVSPIANQFGVSLGESAAALGVLANNGVTASRAGTGLRRILLELGRSGESLTDILKRLAESNLTVAEAKELVGVRGVTALLALTREWETVVELTDQANQNTNAYIASLKNLSTTQAQIDLIGVAWDNVKRNIGESIKNTQFYIGLLDLVQRTLDEEGFRQVEVSRIGELLGDDEIKRIQDLLSDRGNSDSYVFSQVLQALGDAGEKLEKSDWPAVTEFLRQLKELNNTTIAQNAGRLDVVSEYGGQLTALNAQFQSGELNINEYNRAVTDLVNTLDEDVKATEKRIELLDEEDAIQKSLITIEQSRIENLARLKNQATGGGLEVTDLNTLPRLKDAYYLLEEQLDSLKDSFRNGDAIDGFADKVKNLDEDMQALLAIIRLIDEDFEKKVSGKAKKRVKEGGVKLQDRPLIRELIPNNVRQQVEKAIRDGNPKKVKEIQESDASRFNEAIAWASRTVISLPDVTVRRWVETYTAYWIDAIAQAEANKVGEVQGTAKSASVGDGSTGPKDYSGLINPRLQENLDKAKNILDKIQEGYQRVAPEVLNLINNRLEAEKAAIDARFQYEKDALTAQQRSGLISQSQYEAQLKGLTEKRLRETNEIERKQFNADKANRIAEATIAGAISLVEALPNIPLSIFTGATTAAQISLIAAQRFQPTQFAEGGWIGGNLHSNGGTPFTIDGKGGFEAERGEFIVNRHAMSDPVLGGIVQSINSYGPNSIVKGGNKFAAGGAVQSPSGVQVEIIRDDKVEAFISPKELSERSNTKVRTDKRSRLG